MFRFDNTIETQQFTERLVTVCLHSFKKIRLDTVALDFVVGLNDSLKKTDTKLMTMKAAGSGIFVLKDKIFV